MGPRVISWWEEQNPEEQGPSKQVENSYNPKRQLHCAPYHNLFESPKNIPKAILRAWKKAMTEIVISFIQIFYYCPSYYLWLRKFELIVNHIILIDARLIPSNTWDECKY